MRRSRDKLVPDYLTLDDVAARLGVSVKTARRRVADGTLPAVRIGRLIRVPASALDSVGRPLTVAKAAR